MSDSTRRGFLAAAGLGTAAAGAAVVLGSTPANAATVDAEATLPAGAPDTLMALVHNVKKGEVTLLIHGSEVAVTDKALAHRIAHAYHRASKA